MTRFGDELRQEREARGLSVEDICAITKVSQQNIRMLEAGEYAGLPGGVFRKGIVRSYLGALGLDEPSWIQRFDQSCREVGLGGSGERDWVEFAENVKKSRGSRTSGINWRWVGVIILLALLGAGTWAAWHFVVRHKGTPGQVTRLPRAADQERDHWIYLVFIDKCGSTFFTCS